MLRDVRDGAEPTVVRAPSAVVSPPASPSPPPASHELLSAVIGKAFIIVPVAAIVAFGLWTGYEQGVGSGMSVGGALLISIGSLLVTVGVAFALAARGKKH